MFLIIFYNIISQKNLSVNQNKKQSMPLQKYVPLALPRKAYCRMYRPQQEQIPLKDVDYIALHEALSGAKYHHLFYLFHL